MYNIYNKSEVYFCWDIKAQTEYLIGNEKELIHWLAKQYRTNWWTGSELLNDTLDSYACNIHETNKSCQIFDGMGRCINPRWYEREARLLYLNYYKKKDKRDYFYWHKNNINYAFRYDPVPHTRKRKGGPAVKARRIKSLKMMYSNPEYKDFNRGSRKDIPDGWWDDWYRCNQKNWKKQRKHQWKEKKE